MLFRSNFFFHDKELRDNPPLAKELRNDSIAPAVNPYNHQLHVYDKNRPENIEFLKRFRALLDEYPGTTAVGEVGDAQIGLQIVSDYTSGNDKMHMCYAFEFLANEKLTAPRVRKVMTDFNTVAPEGWACWAFSNHDVVRHASRWGSDVKDLDHYLRLLAGLIMTLRGSICLYQGEELGLTEADLAFEDLQDPYGIQFWPDFKGRDGCRTPMVWSEHEQSAGFTNGQPWLPVPPEHRQLAVDAQDHVQASMLNHYRRLLTFRHAHRPLSKGSLEFPESGDQVLAMIRRDGNESIYCAFNMSDQMQVIDRPEGLVESLDGHGFSGFLRSETIELSPYDAFFGRLG